MPRLIAVTVLLSAVALLCCGQSTAVTTAETETDVLVQRMIQQVHSMRSDVDQIIEAATSGIFKGITYERLANFTDTIGPRVCGSAQLEAAVNFMVNEMKNDGLNVHTEAVTLPYWIRGEESATLLTPRVAKLSILGLGSSIGTPAEGITAEAIVVQSYEELKARAAEVPGKIVIYDSECDWKKEPVRCYGVTVAFRGSGADHASQYGAVAALVKSAAGFSINSPHTGTQYYSGQVPKIPVASITLEDAEMFKRMQTRGQTITINLKMQAQNMQPTTGHNVIAEIKGTDYPEQTVIVSGHLDSWDVGQGAMDDGGGMMISYSALSLLNRLGLRPKRTIRAILWSCEEFGGIGADQYYTEHQNEVPTMDLVMESDLGTFHPTGIQFTGNAAATAVMQSVVQLFSAINATTLAPGGEGTDISPWQNAGVPGASLQNENEKYFWFHHSNGDTMAVQDPHEMDLCTAVWTATAYVVASLDDMLPR